MPQIVSAFTCACLFRTIIIRFEQNAVVSECWWRTICWTSGALS